MNYSTLSRTLTPIDNITTSGSAIKSNSYLPNNTSMNNQTAASNTPMLNQTHYNSQGGFLGKQAQHNAAGDHSNASYLNPNQSSLMMMGLFQS